MIAAIPNNNRTQVIGEKITEEEARDYFTKNAASLESSLAASGVEIAEIWYDGAESNFMGTVLCAKGSLLFKKGYCHISYDGNTDESKPGLTVKQNFMDFHVYNAGRLVAIVTLVKENGLIYGTPAFGAPWFDSFDKELQKYAGKKVQQETTAQFPTCKIRQESSRLSHSEYVAGKYKSTPCSCNGGPKSYASAVGHLLYQPHHEGVPNR